MSTLEPRVIIFENNATRADLYAYWLSEFDVHLALTKRQAARFFEETFDDSFVVAILAEEFADGAAARILETIRSGAPDCRVLTTASNPAQVCPALDVDNHLPKPIFEEELREKVDRLARRSVYCAKLKEYYRITVELATVEFGGDGATSADRERLEERAEQLQSILAEVAAALDPEDVQAVLAELTEDAELPSEAPAPDSKYVPHKCPKCDAQWDDDEEPTQGPVLLGSFVWRCRDCGHVQIHASPRDGRLAPFLRA